MRSLLRWLELSWLTLKYSLFCLLRFLKLYPHSYPKIIRMYFQEAGGVLVKVGQILALRYEILPPQYCWELSELFDNVTPMSFDEVRGIIVKEFGKQPNQIFAVFEEQPVASASFAQVHRAVLLDGRKVAVKIQRPGLLSNIKDDFRYLKAISFIISPFFSLKALPIREVFKELEQTTFVELDYQMERENAEIIRKNIVEPERFFVPETFAELTTDHVLVQEFVEGIKLNDILRVKRQNSTGNPVQNIMQIDLEKVATDIISEMARQYFVNGIYHSDPHPGNVILTPDNKIAFVDFGIVGHVKPHSRALLWDFIKSVAVKPNTQKAAQSFLRLGLRQIEDRLRFLAQDKEEVVDTLHEIIEDLASSYEKSLGSVILSWSDSIGNSSRSLYDRSTAVAFLRAMRMAEQYNVHFQRDLILFIRALVIADMMAMQLSPDFRTDNALKQFALKNEPETRKLEESSSAGGYIEHETLTDPWDEDVRSEIKEYIFDWFQALIDNRPALYKKIKFSTSKLKSML